MGRVMPSPIIIGVAPTGARRTRADHPALPLTIAEIAREAAVCREAGAVLLHLHVRDRDGRHTLDPDLYREAMAAVRREAGPDLIIQITTEAVGRFTVAEQMATVRAVRPEAVSLAVREIVPDAAAEPTAAAFLAECAGRGTLLQYIVYTPDDLARCQDLVARGVIPGRHASVLFVLGRHAEGQVSRPDDLSPFLAVYALHRPWFLCAFGAQEGACALAAAERGGHARVGFENNLALADGSPAPGNAALVAQLAAGAARIHRALATYSEAVALLTGR
jgi:uncharacterized protein (DUF849 family)